jgi:hypothetical protein
MAVIQTNAICSWLAACPSCEVLLFGDEEGAAEAARKFGLHHIPKIDRNESGTPLIGSLFQKAQEMASYELLCQINGDIILMSDFVQAIRMACQRSRKFLMAGQRWDADLKERWDFNQPDWEVRLRDYVKRFGKLHPPTGLDYFVFPKGMLGDLPQFAIGRRVLDNWLIYRMRSLAIPVIDATKVITAIHQNHDYSYHPQGEKGVMEGPEMKCNLELAGGYSHLLTLQDANWILTSHGLERPSMTMERLRRYLDTLPVLSPRIAPFAPYLRLVNILLSPRSMVGAIKQKLHKFL